MADLNPDPDVVVALDAAFPRHLRAEVQGALGVLPPAKYPPAWPFHVLVAGEPVAIPYRVYPDEPSPDAQAALSPIQRAIVDCLYTRHHDGRVRQNHLERVVGLTEPWVAPFVVQLIGEYVDEILLAIQRDLAPPLTTPDSSAGRVYGRFAAENPAFLAITGQRVASYWSCYYRQRYPALTDYPGHALIAALRIAARRCSTAVNGVSPRSG
ncbi:hypothetical protein [Micromonospora costi]|uniref:Uncharacterized protein n=1 Tax=Micromonospora costi TaxID=1530042 RepID=A0A3B0A4G5_9ACTN|nr:hypothetical protein [Micromonospora costi]RKN55391.1 hypothetical protein D7193_12060 [Micromonospora costi]